MNSFEVLFKSKHSEWPTWMCIIMTILVISSAYIVLTDLAGVLDYLAKSEPMEVQELDYNSMGKVASIVAKKAERGMFSYYMEAYPILMADEIIGKALNFTEVLQNYMIEINELETQEEKGIYAIEHSGSAQQLTNEIELYKDTLSDRFMLSSILSAMYKIVSLILACFILKIPTGIYTKILYKIYTRDVRWIM